MGWVEKPITVFTFVGEKCKLPLSNENVPRLIIGTASNMTWRFPSTKRIKDGGVGMGRENFQFIIISLSCTAQRELFIKIKFPSSVRFSLIPHRLTLTEEMGFRKQPAGFSTKAIHVGQDPDQWNSR